MKYIAYKRDSGVQAFSSKTELFDVIGQAKEGDFFLKVFQIEMTEEPLFDRLMESFPHLFSTLMSWEMNHRDWYTSFEFHASRSLHRTVQLLFDSFRVTVLTLIAHNGKIRTVSERSLGRISDFSTQPVLPLAGAESPSFPVDNENPSRQLQMRLYTLRKEIHADDSSSRVPVDILARLNTRTKSELINLLRLGMFNMAQLQQVLSQHQSSALSDADTQALFQWLKQSESALATGNNPRD